MPFIAILLDPPKPATPSSAFPNPLPIFQTVNHFSNPPNFAL
jgi:hypothetical protein